MMWIVIVIPRTSHQGDSSTREKHAKRVEKGPKLALVNEVMDRLNKP